MDSKKLLEGLGANINAKVLADFTARSGVFVKVRVSRPRGGIQLPPQLVGIHPDSYKESSKLAYNKYVQLGKLCFIPIEVEKELVSIESAIRYKLSKHCVSTNSFMPLDGYAMFKPEFAEAQTEYANACDFVASNWDDYMADFRVGLESLLDESGLPDYQKDQLRDSVLKNLPSKEGYRNACAMEMEVQAFASTPDLSVFTDPDLSDAVRDGYKKMVMENAIDCIRDVITDVFDFVCGMIGSSNRTGKISQHSIESVKEISARVREKNIFRNPLIEASAEMLSKIGRAVTEEERRDLAVNAAVAIWRYGKETGLNLKVKDKKGITAQQLDAFAAVQ